VDNDVPSLSIGGFTNGVRVVDMAKGYSTLANGGIYNDRTCILRIEHEHDGDVTKSVKHYAKQVYQEDTAYMITDVLKGTLNEPYGTGYGLALADEMPAAGKTGTTNSSKDTWFCGYTRYYTTAVWVGYDIPRAMPGIYGSTYAGKIWKNVMDRIHTDLEPWDWEQPETVEERTNESTGVTDLVSTTGELRAQQTLHDKEQQRTEEAVKALLEAFEDKTIETVEDTYWVKEQYQSIISKLNILDDGTLRGEYLERTENKYKEFAVTIGEMQDTIKLYEGQKEREQAEARKKAEEAAAKRRADLEVQTRKNEFLTALRDVEGLEYQSADAENLIQIAISKLSYVDTYSEVTSYKARLDTAIRRVATLPTQEEWEAQEAEKAAAQEAQDAALQSQIGRDQQQLGATLNREKSRWNNSTVAVGQGPSGSVSSGPATETRTTGEGE
jgi:penicillin-binding protein 1A